MKKHDEGYILAYVFVILVVICLIATSVLSVPLMNLKTQKTAIQEMQDQYIAQGNIEQALADICMDLKKLGMKGPYNYLKIPADAEDATPGAQEAVSAQVQSTIALILSNTEGNTHFISGVTAEMGEWSAADSYTYPISVTAKSGSVEISCKILLKDVIKNGGTSFTIQVPSFEYAQYEVTELEGG